LIDYLDYQRLYHLEYIPLPGGDKAIREPWRTAISWLISAGLPLEVDLPPIRYALTETKLPRYALDAIQNQVKYHINAPSTSSMGRLFDAAASIAGVRQFVNYEAQAAIEFEMLVDSTEMGMYPFEIQNQQISMKPLICALVADVYRRTPTPIIAARVHNTIAYLVSWLSERIRDEYGINNIALSGGVWQNITLLEKSLRMLADRKFNVYIHHQVPTNDAGISFGQAIIAYHKISQL